MTSITAPNLGQQSAFVEAVGLRLSEIAPSRVTGWIELGPEHHTPWGIVHGGVYASAIESATTLGASAAAAERGQIAVGVTNATNFLRPVTAGRVNLTATPLQQGRTQQFWQAEIRDSAGKLIAIGHVHLQNVEPRNSP